MAKKLQGNSLCTCGSGLKYNECCGKNEPIKGNTLTYLGPNTKSLNEAEIDLMNYTGYNPNSYVKPISKKAPIIYILLDESKIEDCYSMSGVVYEKSQVGNLAEVKKQMHILVKQYNIDYFHFTDIFGRNKILRGKEFDFIYKYSAIVSKLDFTPFSLSMLKEDICKLHRVTDMSDEGLFISLQWQLMYKVLVYLIWKYGSDLIIHMRREQENITEDKAKLHYINAQQIQEKFPFANISFYKYYDIFMKTEVLNSSISDLVAYVSSGVLYEESKCKSPKRISNDYYKPLLLLHKCFSDYSHVGILKLNEYISHILKSEEHRSKTNDINER